MVRIGEMDALFTATRHSEPLGRYAPLLADTHKARQTIEYRIGHACAQWIDVERENE